MKLVVFLLMTLLVGFIDSNTGGGMLLGGGLATYLLKGFK